MQNEKFELIQSHDLNWITPEVVVSAVKVVTQQVDGGDPEGGIGPLGS